MLQRQVVVRLFVADGADDAGLAVGQAGDRDAGCLAQAATRGPRRRPPAGSAPPARRRCAPWRRPSRRSTVAVAGANTRSAGRVGKVAVQRHAQAARLHHPAERSGILARLVVVEMQVQPRGAAAQPPVADADVQDRVGRHRQPVPQPGRHQQVARTGGDGVGAAVERRVLHRRQRGAVHHDGANAGARRGGRRACRPPGPRPMMQTNRRRIVFGHRLYPVLTAWTKQAAAIAPPGRQMRGHAAPASRGNCPGWPNRRGTMAAARRGRASPRFMARVLWQCGGRLFRGETKPCNMSIARAMSPGCWSARSWCC